MHADFWWLPECDDRWLVGVAHQEPLGDDDDVRSALWDYSSGQSGTRRGNPPQITMGSLTEWRDRWSNINVYRTLVITRPDGTRVVGPFVVDIDNENEDGLDLDDAMRVARRAVGYLVEDHRVGPSDLRVLFTGHKGFNIEVRPGALRLPPQVDGAVYESCQLLDHLIRALRSLSSPDLTRNRITDRGTVIDGVYGSPAGGARLKYPYVRLHGSINRWVDTKRGQVSRMKVAVTASELNGPVEAVISKAESLAASGEVHHAPS